MSEKLSITEQYSQYFDDCRPIEYKGVVISPFLAKDIRLCNYACYCLTVEPVEFDDISLMPLKRLDLILTILDRGLRDEIPTSGKIAEKYDLVMVSFKTLLQNVFNGYEFDFQDPDNPRRNRVLTIMEPESKRYKVFGAKEFEEIADLILYHNGIDILYRLKYPYGLRKELDEKLKKMNKEQNTPSIEKMIDSAFLFVGDYEKLLNLPVRKFYNLIENIQKKEGYEIIMSGDYERKNITHWMSGGYEKDPYKDLVTTAEQVMGKFKEL